MIKEIKTECLTGMSSYLFLKIFKKPVYKIKLLLAMCSKAVTPIYGTKIKSLRGSDVVNAFKGQL